VRAKRAILLIVATPVALIATVLVYYFLMLDWQGRPFCHKQINTAFRLWMRDRHTDAFPNVAGSCRQSLEAIRDEMGGEMKWAENYRYVAGLREDDPGDLILMYVGQPTRWTWHGSPPNRFTKKAWIVVPVDFTMGDRPRAGHGELSERISSQEFKRRLQVTLEFVKTNERPNWEAVVAEHTRFLDQLGLEPK
jgi:hypothetical protein